MVTRATDGHSRVDLFLLDSILSAPRFMAWQWQTHEWLYAIDTSGPGAKGTQVSVMRPRQQVSIARLFSADLFREAGFRSRDQFQRRSRFVRPFDASRSPAISIIDTASVLVHVKSVSEIITDPEANRSKLENMPRIVIPILIRQRRYSEFRYAQGCVRVLFAWSSL